MHLHTLALLLILPALSGPLGAQGKAAWTATALGSVNHAPALTLDCRFVENGSPWDGEGCVWWEGTASGLVLDLQAPTDIRDFRLQVDNNDDYLLEGSLDGETYTPLLTIRAQEGQVSSGMDTFSTVKGEKGYLARIDFAKPLRARYLRLRGTEGDECYSVAEITVIPMPPGKTR